MLLSANLATPLYAVYARRFGFSTAVLALVFAVYALVLIPALLVFGQLSDRLGRRPVIALGLGLAVLALVLFAVASGKAWLLAARGTLGVLAQWAPWPEVLPFAAGMAVCLLVGAGLWSVPETAGHRSGGLRVRTPHVPPEIRGAFLRVGLTGAAVWAVAAGLFLSVMPSYAGELVVHSKNLALLALLTSVVLLASFATQLVLRKGAPPAAAQAAGLVLLAAGLAAL
ncbi:MAG TPA: MFS transporter, partial [Trebonia sp.]|nr:MFS transporter [Trebonia sp.]